MARRSAEDPGGSRGKSVVVPTMTDRRSDRFLNGLADATRATFVSHIYPDPDSLASMMGLAHLIETKIGIPTRLTQDGPISRAENRAMVDLLHLDLIPIEDIHLEAEEKVIMVDSQPGTGRHSFNGEIPIHAVIDHHITPGKLENVPFVDVRRHLGATCSLVTRYLIEQHVEPPRDVATALLYGIETELAGYPREANRLDDEALAFLYPVADKDLVARIRNARLPLEHFESMLLGLQNSFVYDRLIISWISDLSQPELAAEVCDFLIRFEEVEWAVCAGVHQDKLFLSARTSLTDGKAGDMLRSVVGRLGRAGGHDRRAGGCIHLESTAPSAIEDVQAELRRRLLKVLKIDECRGRRLMPKRELLQNLQA